MRYIPSTASSQGRVCRVLATTALLIAIPFVQHALGQLPASSGSSTPGGDPILERCVVKFVDDVEIPASEAGVLMMLSVKDGAVVDKDEVIARIDDREVQMQKEIAVQEFNAALVKYKDDIDEKYAKKAAEVAEQEYIAKQEANSKGIEGVVTESELRKLKLDYERSVLAIEKAAKDRIVAKHEALIAKAKVDAADMAIEKRTIRAPFAGEVRSALRQQSEWVAAGEPILEFVRYDVLKVDGYLDLADYDPGPIAGREVTITVVLSGGQQATAKGRVVLVEQQIKQSDRARYKVRAEIPNRKIGDRWLIMPGLTATMQIHLDRPAVNVSRRRAAQ